MSKPVRVQIYDQSYLIGGDLEEAYVQKLAGFVDNKMRDVAEATHTVDSLKVAVLSALAIADELHSLRNERERSPDAYSATYLQGWSGAAFRHTVKNGNAAGSPAFGSLARMNPQVTPRSPLVAMGLPSSATRRPLHRRA